MKGRLEGNSEYLKKWAEENKQRKADKKQYNKMYYSKNKQKKITATKNLMLKDANKFINSNPDWFEIEYCLSQVDYKLRARCKCFGFKAEQTFDPKCNIGIRKSQWGNTYEVITNWVEVLERINAFKAEFEIEIENSLK